MRGLFFMLEGNNLRRHFNVNRLASAHSCPVDDIAKFVRALEGKGLSSSTIENHLKPLSGTFRYAVAATYWSCRTPTTLSSRRY